MAETSQVFSRSPLTLHKEIYDITLHRYSKSCVALNMSSRHPLLEVYVDKEASDLTMELATRWSGYKRRSACPRMHATAGAFPRPGESSPRQSRGNTPHLFPDTSCSASHEEPIPLGEVTPSARCLLASTPKPKTAVTRILAPRIATAGSSSSIRRRPLALDVK
jgi:hypothetical protein